jgi:hypothetical protein
MEGCLKASFGAIASHEFPLLFDIREQRMPMTENDP